MKLLTYTIAISILMCLGTLRSHAQKSFPDFEDKPLWTVDRTFFFDHDKFVVSYFDSITICGKKYSYLKLYIHGDTTFVRSENQRVYARITSNCDSTEKLLYDFSMEAGDSVYVTGSFDLFSDSTIVYCDSIDSLTTFDGITRKRLWVNYEPVFGSTQWIEGIGSIYHPFYHFLIWNGCECWYNLMCYSEDTLHVYESPDTIRYDNCEIIYTNVEEYADIQTKLHLYPNPTSGFVNLQFELQESTSLSISIVDLTGRILHHETEKNYQGGIHHLNIQNTFPPGIYFVELKIDEQSFTKKLVVH